jgi:hypothetical protein
MYRIKNHKRLAKLASAIALATVTQLATSSAHALELYKQGDSQLDFNFTAMYAWMTSQEGYYGVDGRTTWQEAFANYGLSGSTALGNAGSLYGGLSLVTSGTWGDGDAGGNTDGSEDDTDWEDAYIGWKSGDTLSGLGKDGLDISVGRQGMIVGDGFILKNDGLAYGQPFGDKYDRGGAYYLAGRQAFSNTAIVRVGGEQGPRADFAWLKSNNPGQSKFEFALANFEYNSEQGNVGFMYLDGLDVDKDTIFDSHLERKNMHLYGLRGNTSAGVENLFLSAEYVIQDKLNSATAGYAEVGYTLADLPWSPTLTYRYSRYSEHYDSLFNGFTRGYGTWYQGEVAGNFSGPFNCNTEIQHVGLKLSPSESLSMGVLYFDFSTLNKDYGNSDAHELDFYLEWMPTENYYISPTIGLFDPKRDLANGGSQTADNELSLYGQVTVGVFF